MNREFIIKSNQAVKNLEEKGFDCIGRTAADNFKTVCVVKNGKQYFFTNYIEANENLKSLKMENNPLIYATVLRNIAKNTPAEEKANETALEFEKNIKLQGIKTEKEWETLAHVDFIRLIHDEIMKLQKIKEQSLKSIVYISSK